MYAQTLVPERKNFEVSIDCTSQKPLFKGVKYAAPQEGAAVSLNGFGINMDCIT